MINIKVFEDIWYTVLPTEVDEYRVSFNVYELGAIPMEPTGQSMLTFTKDESRNNTTERVEEADIFLHGSVKWDGCSDWHFDEQDRVMIHGCSRDNLVEIGEVMARCWDWAFELMGREKPE